jgi:hypothetical protein
MKVMDEILRKKLEDIAYQAAEKKLFEVLESYRTGGSDIKREALIQKIVVDSVRKVFYTYGYGYGTLRKIEFMRIRMESASRVALLKELSARKISRTEIIEIELRKELEVVAYEAAEKRLFDIWKEIIENEGMEEIIEQENFVIDIAEQSVKKVLDFYEYGCTYDNQSLKTRMKAAARLAIRTVCEEEKK